MQQSFVCNSLWMLSLTYSYNNFKWKLKHIFLLEAFTCRVRQRQKLNFKKARHTQENFLITATLLC